ncbi:Rab family GTPase [Aliarcobacter vitoriensis]|uniref:GTP-binding protein n=1 Tax=Aliarcobacter vitoriensis TaxID=2011099 RepID=A0A366MSB9_9BACT|nr:Rab family GTPase [Aliarcobacter vitoriensis]RBQ29176.1 GTP-binding protein [Aliarcobacter vitoriensis]
MFSYKIVLVGDYGTGKTSLIRRFVDNSFSEEYKSSIGVAISKKELISNINSIEHKSIMMIWDIEGKTDFQPIFAHHLMGSKAFIIVADVTRKESLDSINEHILLCQKSVGTAPIFIALNKSDLQHEEIDLNSIKSLSSNVIKVFKTSAKDETCVNDIFEILNFTVVGNLIK